MKRRSSQVSWTKPGLIHVVMVKVMVVMVMSMNEHLQEFDDFIVG